MNIDVNILIASPADAAAIAEVISEAALDLTEKHGPGHWSTTASAKGILIGMNRSKVLVAKSQNKVIGSLRLTTTRPWVIDPTYFTKVERPVYLVDMAIRPGYQRIGVGRALIEQAKIMAKTLSGNALRLDAYEGVAGAGGFYEKCGFTSRGNIVYKTVPHIYFEWLIGE